VTHFAAQLLQARERLFQNADADLEDLIGSES
jgi:hypothetical protein